MWVPILTAPVQMSTDASLFAGNSATYYFRVPYNIASTQVVPSGNFNVSTSYVYAMGLAVAYNTLDRNFDKVASVMQAKGYDIDLPLLGEFDKFQIASGGQTAIDYTVSFYF
jgi:hypothetical protein